MPEVDSATKTIDAARTAVSADLANVASSIDTAIAGIDAQLSSLHERRNELEAGLAAVNDQIAAVDAHRKALAAARDQVPGDGQVQVDADAMESEYLEFAEDELAPEVPRTERVLTVLSRVGADVDAAYITEILNEFGDSTTAKVVGGTLSNLARRGAVKKTGPGQYAGT